MFCDVRVGNFDNYVRIPPSNLVQVSQNQAWVNLVLGWMYCIRTKRYKGIDRDITKHTKYIQNFTEFIIQLGEASKKVVVLGGGGLFVFDSIRCRSLQKV